MSTHVSSVRSYLLVYVSLMVLLALTLAAGAVDLGTFNLTIALVIALIKAIIVVLFFMHVRFGTPLLKVFVAAGFVWFIILLVLTFSDYLTRGWVPAGQSPLGPQLPPVQSQRIESGDGSHRPGAEFEAQ